MKLFYIDLEQAESRTVGAITYQLFGDPTYLDACESGDLHTLVCAMCWTDLPWPENFGLGGDLSRLSEAKKVASVLAYRDMTYRDLAKRLGHGSNYRGQPPHMAKATHVDVKIIKRFQKSYFSAFPSIPRWHRWVAEQLQIHRQITTFLGRRRFFFGRPGDDTTLREAIAYEPQSVATGDYMNLGLYKVWEKNLPINLFGQIHDAIAGEYNEADEATIIPEICKTLEVPITITTPDGKPRQFSIPTEPMVGWNLAYRSTDNPDGLIKWRNTDNRTRTRPAKKRIECFDFKTATFRS